MCLATNRLFFVKRMKKTKEDIFVKKMIQVYDNGDIRSPIYYFLWKFDKEYEISVEDIKKSMETVSGYWRRKQKKTKQLWNYGFHSYDFSKTKEDCSSSIDKRLEPCGFTVRLFKAVIPKGSYVVYGRNDDILSNKLMLLNEKL